MGSRRLGFLDALRGIAALAVVFQHVGERLSPDLQLITTHYFQAGQFGVMLFFLCSGFIIPVSLERHGSLLSFWISRVFRLYPLYWFSLAAAVTLFVLGRFGLPGGFAESPFGTILVNATMLEGFVGVAYAIPLYWSLTFEMLFYVLVSAAFVLGLNRRTTLLATGSLALSILGGIGAPIILGRPGPIGIFFNIATMFVGTMIYRYHADDTTRQRLIAVLALAGVAIVAILTANFAGRDEIVHGGTRSFLPMLSAWTLAYLVFLGGFATRQRSFPAAGVHVGRVSYSVYLLHPLVMSLLPTFADAALTALLWILATLAAASATYFAIEAPFIALGHRLARSVARR